ncbi:MAG: amidohydrolase family protein [Frankiales bacterium]|nr:amidohydrolase family protein [Frankiales bacterium]
MTEAKTDVARPLPIAVVNARVWTFDAVVPSASAFLVVDGRIARVGSTAEILGAAGREARTLDCSGATVVPGFVDGHCHFELTCVTTDRWLNVHTPPFDSLTEIAEAIGQRLEEDDETSDEWLLCRSSFAAHEKVREQRLFTRQELDRLSDRRPLAVFASLHVASLNTVALRRLGLWDSSAPHPFHGVVHRDGDGTPTGVVTEVFMMVPSPGSDDEFLRSVQRHGHDLFGASGTTTVLTMPESVRQVHLLRELHRQRGLGLRQRYYLISPGVATMDEASQLLRAEQPTDTFSFGGLKVFVNGCGHDGLGSRLEDVKWTEGELSAFVVEADRRGIQVWLHSLTADGVRMAARAILEAGGHRGNPRRHRIEHGGDYVDLEDLGLIAASGALMVTTPQFLHSMSADETGPRAPVRSLAAAGIRVLGGTDSTGTVPSSVSILGNVATAVTRRRTDGTVLHADESLDVEDAFRLFTTNAAYGGFLEDHVGSLSVGKRADFALLSEDPREVDPLELGRVRVLSTHLGGECVWNSDRGGE